MFQEQFQVNIPVGLHFGPLSGLQRIPVTINGLPTASDSWDKLYGLGKGGEPVTIAADSGNPQVDRDLVHLAMGIINFERDLWPGNQGQIPLEAVNQWANLVRSLPAFGLNIPQEGPSVIPDEKLFQLSQRYSSAREYKKGELSGPVSGEMKEAVLSKWTVVALGELQQPGGVGATQVGTDSNPVLADQPPDSDNSQNSHEQAVALETWVNYAVDMLNRGEQDEAILAKLAHDGCPDPPAILERAKEQPMEEKPISDEIGQDPFEAPMPDDGQTGQMESVERQPPVVTSSMVKEAPGKEHMKGVSEKRNRQYEHIKEQLMESGKSEEEAKEEAARTVNKQRAEHGETKKDSRVRIAGSSQTGTVIDEWRDTWGQGLVMVALDEGGTLNVSPDAVEPVDEEAPEHPVTKIQQFIDSMEPVQPTRPHIEARIANLEAVRLACRNSVSGVGFADQVKLASIDSDALAEIRSLKEFLGAVATEADVTYLDSQPKYRPHGIAQPGVVPVVANNESFDRRIAEEAAIFAAELPAEVAAFADATAYAAAWHAAGRNGNVAEFVRLAEERRVVRAEEFAPAPEDAEETTDADGPAEGLYL